MNWLLRVSLVLLVLGFVVIVGEQRAIAQDGGTTGKVTAVTAGKSISVETANGKVVTFNLTQFTKVQGGQLTVGATVTVQGGDNPRNARVITVKKE